MARADAGSSGTERKASVDIEALRAETDDLREKLAKADVRMSEFVGRLAHELRSPLGAILMWAHVLRAGGESEREAAVEAIDASAHAQSKMIAELLDVTRALAGRLQIPRVSLDLRDPLRMALDDSASAAAVRAINLRTSISDLPARVEGDMARLRETFTHLIGNAIKFTPEGGMVEVRLAIDQRRARVVVRDNGCGIARDKLAGIFGAFRSFAEDGRGVVGGLGLGLAFVRLVVELHGGTAAADSDGPDHGSTFVVELPLQTSG